MDIDYSKPIKSPHKDHKGTIRFPFPFVADTYRRWNESNQAYRKAIEENGVKLMVTGTYFPNGDGKDLDRLDAAKWGSLMAMCDVKLANMPEGWEDSNDGEIIPFKVLAWAIPLFDAYIEEALNLKAFT